MYYNDYDFGIIAEVRTFMSLLTSIKNMHMLRKLAFTAVFAFFALSLSAKVTLGPVFSDNMVLQQNTEVKFWGKALPKKKVTLSTSWNGAVYTTAADETGSWSINVDTPSAGGPYTVTLADGKEKTVLENVLVGEVWICSGQSNMEMRVMDVSAGWKEHLAEAPKYSNIRTLHVSKDVSPVPMDGFESVGGGWKVGDNDALMTFSAVAYYFGRRLNENLDVPIGLIETCQGGTVIEAWTSADALACSDDFRTEIEKLSVLPVAKEDREALFQSEVDVWSEQMKKVDHGFKDGKAVWAEVGYDDSSWESCRFPDFLQFQGFPSTVGYFWVRKTIDIPASCAGKKLHIKLGSVDDNNYTYFNGVELGHVELCTSFSEYDVPAELVKAGKAVIAVRVMDTGGMGGILGDPESMVVEGPDGVVASLAGEWKFKMLFGLADAPVFPVNTAKEPNYPTFLYNAMIHPLIDFPIAGAIWYQGESNASRAAQYKDLLPLMINDWRQKWGYDFPFYIAQLANYMEVQKGPEESEWAELREAQLQALAVKNTGMAVLIDVGEAYNIHPGNKMVVGDRLAYNALACTYGFNIPYSGPLYDGYRLEGDSVRLYFSHVDGGLVAKGGEAPEGFYVAGPDHVFHKACAVIDGDTVVVSSEKVPYPVAVRYAWADNPVCNLYNGAGLPASPFRTDSW